MDCWLKFGSALEWKNSTQSQSTTVKHRLLDSCQPGEETETKASKTADLIQCPHFKNDPFKSFALKAKIIYSEAPTISLCSLLGSC